jgi:hypothetical protein
VQYAQGFASKSIDIRGFGTKPSSRLSGKGFIRNLFAFVQKKFHRKRFLHMSMRGCVRNLFSTKPK